MEEEDLLKMLAPKNTYRGNQLKVSQTKEV